MCIYICMHVYLFIHSFARLLVFIARRTYTAQQALLAREDNITMFAVGVGHSVSNLELFNIAGDQERVFRSDNYEDLRHIKTDLSHKTCTCELSSMSFFCSEIKIHK